MIEFFKQNHVYFVVGPAVLISLIAFALMCVDKLRAVRHRGRRIPEKTLLGLSLCFGSFGTLLAMPLLRHKINPGRHPAFAYGVPVMAMVQGAALLFLLGILE